MVTALAAAVFLAACTGKSSIKPEEVLDERSGMTVGALQSPIELVESAAYATLPEGRRASFAYLGPVEWDSSGDITYALWLHVAPGNDKPVGDIRSPGAVTMVLESGSEALTPVEPPSVGLGPYKPVASWGQTGYFGLDAATLRRMAASGSIKLEFQGADRSEVEFLTSRDNRDTLVKFMQARGITAD
jgi:hypothetical protein